MTELNAILQQCYQYQHEPINNNKAIILNNTLCIIIMITNAKTSPWRPSLSCGVNDVIHDNKGVNISGE